MGFHSNLNSLDLHAPTRLPILNESQSNNSIPAKTFAFVTRYSAATSRYGAAPISELETYTGGNTRVLGISDETVGSGNNGSMVTFGLVENVPLAGVGAANRGATVYVVVTGVNLGTITLTASANTLPVGTILNTGTNLVDLFVFSLESGFVDTIIGERSLIALYDPNGTGIDPTLLPQAQTTVVAPDYLINPGDYFIVTSNFTGTNAFNTPLNRGDILIAVEPAGTNGPARADATGWVVGNYAVNKAVEGTVETYSDADRNIAARPSQTLRAQPAPGTTDTATGGNLPFKSITASLLSSINSTRPHIEFPAITNSDDRYIDIDLTQETQDQLNNAPLAWVATAGYTENQIVFFDGATSVGPQLYTARMDITPLPSGRGQPDVDNIRWSKNITIRSFANTVSYVRDDQVFFENKIYVCVVATSINVLPTSPAPVNWAEVGANTISNATTPGLNEAGLVNAKVGVDTPIKILRGGSNITLTQNADDVIISAADAGSTSRLTATVTNNTGAELAANRSYSLDNNVYTESTDTVAFTSTRLGTVRAGQTGLIWIETAIPDGGTGIGILRGIVELTASEPTDELEFSILTTGTINTLPLDGEYIVGTTIRKTLNLGVLEISWDGLANYQLRREGRLECNIQNNSTSELAANRAYSLDDDVYDPAINLITFSDGKPGTITEGQTGLVWIETAIPASSSGKGVLRGIVNSGNTETSNTEIDFKIQANGQPSNLDLNGSYIIATSLRSPSSGTIVEYSFNGLSNYKITEPLPAPPATPAGFLQAVTLANGATAFGLSRTIASINSNFPTTAAGNIEVGNLEINVVNNAVNSTGTTTLAGGRFHSLQTTVYDDATNTITFENTLLNQHEAGSTGLVWLPNAIPLGGTGIGLLRGIMNVNFGAIPVNGFNSSPVQYTANANGAFVIAGVGDYVIAVTLPIHTGLVTAPRKVAFDGMSATTLSAAASTFNYVEDVTINEAADKVLFTSRVDSNTDVQQFFGSPLDVPAAPASTGEGSAVNYVLQRHVNQNTQSGLVLGFPQDSIPVDPTSGATDSIRISPFSTVPTAFGGLAVHISANTNNTGFVAVKDGGTSLPAGSAIARGNPVLDQIGTTTSATPQRLFIAGSGTVGTALSFSDFLDDYILAHNFYFDRLSVGTRAVRLPNVETANGTEGRVGFFSTTFTTNLTPPTALNTAAGNFANVNILSDNERTTPAASWIPNTGGGSGEANTNSNAEPVGANEVGLVNAKVGVNTPIKTIKGSANVTVTSDDTSITINSSGSGAGTVTTYSDDDRSAASPSISLRSVAAPGTTDGPTVGDLPFKSITASLLPAIQGTKVHLEFPTITNTDTFLDIDLVPETANQLNAAPLAWVPTAGYNENELVFFDAGGTVGPRLYTARVTLAPSSVGRIQPDQDDTNWSQDTPLRCFGLQVPYVLDDQIIDDNKLYICIVATSQAVPPTNTTNWRLIGTGGGTGTITAVNGTDGVTAVTTAGVVALTAPGIATNAGNIATNAGNISTNATNITTNSNILASLPPVFNPALSGYSSGDEVSYLRKIYRARRAITPPQGGTIPTPLASPRDWQGLEAVPIWDTARQSGADPYINGNQAFFEDNIWIYIGDGTSNQSPDAVGQTDWSLPSTTGEDNTNSNAEVPVTGEAGLVNAKVLVDTPIKILKPGTNIALTVDATSVTISSTGTSSGEANTASNAITPGTNEAGLVNAKVGVDLPFKVIKGGTNVTVTQEDDTVTINAAAAGGNVTTTTFTNRGSAFRNSSGGQLTASLSFNTDNFGFIWNLNRAVAITSIGGAPVNLPIVPPPAVVAGDFSVISATINGVNVPGIALSVSTAGDDSIITFTDTSEIINPVVEANSTFILAVEFTLDGMVYNLNSNTAGGNLTYLARPFPSAVLSAGAVNFQQEIMTVNVGRSFTPAAGSIDIQSTTFGGVTQVTGANSFTTALNKDSSNASRTMSEVVRFTVAAGTDSNDDTYTATLNIGNLFQFPVYLGSVANRSEVTSATVNNSAIFNQSGAFTSDPIPPQTTPVANSPSFTWADIGNNAANIKIFAIARRFNNGGELEFIEGGFTPGNKQLPFAQVTVGTTTNTEIYDIYEAKTGQPGAVTISVRDA